MSHSTSGKTSKNPIPSTASRIAQDVPKEQAPEGIQRKTGVAMSKSELNRLRRSGKEDMKWLADTRAAIAAGNLRREVPLSTIQDRPYSLGDRQVDPSLLEERRHILRTYRHLAEVPIVRAYSKDPTRFDLIDGAVWVAAAKGSELTLTVVVVECSDARARLLAFACNAKPKFGIKGKEAVAIELLLSNRGLLVQPLRDLEAVLGCKKSTVHRARVKARMLIDDESSDRDDDRVAPPAPAPATLSTGGNTVPPEGTSDRTPPLGSDAQERANDDHPHDQAKGGNGTSRIVLERISEEELVQLAERTWETFSAKFDTAAKRAAFERLLGEIENATKMLGLPNPALCYPVGDLLLASRSSRPLDSNR